MLMMFVNVLLFALELIICAALVFYILKADKWAINMKETVEIGSKEIVSVIKEFQGNLKKVKTTLNYIKNFKYSLTRKLISQTLDLISILQLFTFKKHTKKVWKILSLRMIKGILLGLKMVNE